MRFHLNGSVRQKKAGFLAPEPLAPAPTDYLHFDSNFPNVSNNLLKNVPRRIAAQIFLGGAGLYNFGEEHFRKAAAAAAKFSSKTAAAALGK